MVLFKSIFDRFWLLILICINYSLSLANLLSLLQAFNFFYTLAH